MSTKDFKFNKVDSFVNEKLGIALLIGERTGIVEGPDSQEKRETARDVEVVQRQPDGTWKFIIDHPGFSE